MARTIFNAVKRKKFLEILLEERGAITIAAEKVGVHYKTVCNHRRDDPDFGREVEEVLEEARMVHRDRIKTGKKRLLEKLTTEAETDMIEAPNQIKVAKLLQDEELLENKTQVNVETGDTSVNIRIVNKDVEPFL